MSDTRIREKRRERVNSCTSRALHNCSSPFLPCSRWTASTRVGYEWSAQCRVQGSPQTLPYPSVATGRVGWAPRGKGSVALALHCTALVTLHCTPRLASSGAVRRVVEAMPPLAALSTYCLPPPGGEAAR